MAPLPCHSLSPSLQFLVGRGGQEKLVGPAAFPTGSLSPGAQLLPQWLRKRSGPPPGLGGVRAWPIWMAGLESGAQTGQPYLPWPRSQGRLDSAVTAGGASGSGWLAAAFSLSEANCGPSVPSERQGPARPRSLALSDPSWLKVDLRVLPPAKAEVWPQGPSPSRTQIHPTDHRGPQ